MASPRESKGSTKISVPAPIEQKSQSTRNSARPSPARKNDCKFDPQVFLDTIGKGRKALLFPKKQTIIAQGDPADAIFYLRTGKVRLTVVSKDGKEATIGILSDGSFFGEGSLAGQTLRMGSATAMTDCDVLRIEKKAMVHALHREHTLSDLFVAYLLTRNMQYEADLVDRLFNSSEKRLARVLLMLAHFGKEGIPESVIPKLSQETLAEMVGTTRSRVNFFMNRFRKLGFINYARGSEGVGSQFTSKRRSPRLAGHIIPNGGQAMRQSRARAAPRGSDPMKQLRALSEQPPKRVTLKLNASRATVARILRGNGKEMMLPPQTRDLALRLLACEDAAGKASEPTEFAAFRVCAKLGRPLCALAGVAGFRSLLSRALTLAKVEAPSLSAVQVAADGSLQGLEKLRPQVDADQAREAGIILITQLLGLLVRVVGEATTLQLVRSEIPPDFDFLSKSGIPIGFEAILNEVDDLRGVSARLEGLAEQYPPVTEALRTISGNVLNSATVLAVVAAIKSPKPN